MGRPRSKWPCLHPRWALALGMGVRGVCVGPGRYHTSLLLLAPVASGQGSAALLPEGEAGRPVLGLELGEEPMELFGRVEICVLEVLRTKLRQHCLTPRPHRLPTR